VDVSPEMIAAARRNLPEAEFVISNAAAFDMRGPFDGAVSTFDSLNHIVEPEDLKATFRNTARALRRGAYFAFDMLMEKGYVTGWGDNFALVRDDHVLTITGSGYDFRSRMSQCRLTMFRLIDGAWRRSDSTVFERCYSQAEIGEALEQAGFGEVECYDAGDLGVQGHLGEGRTFFVARKVRSIGAA
jgi:hypothetical protein